jgi:putative redox protein
MDAKVTWKGNGLAFEGTATSGFKLALGSSSESGTPDDGFRPLELLLVGLGGCTAMDVISILQKKRQDVTNFEIQVHAERAEDHPKVFTDVTVEYILTGKALDPAAVDRAVELSVTKYCSAQAMLAKAANITHKVTIREA